MPRTFPVPVQYREHVASEKVQEQTLRYLASQPFEPIGLWASGVVRSLDKSNTEKQNSILKSCNWKPATGESYMGLIDESVDSGDAIVALVKYDPLSPRLLRWSTDGWDSVPRDLEPVGFSYVLLTDEPELVADLIDALSSRQRGLLLRPTQPRTWREVRDSNVLVAAVVPEQTAESVGDVFAVVDDLDTSAILELFIIDNGRALARRAGAWVQDNSLLARLKGIDPPQVVKLLPQEVDAAIRDSDMYDQSHPDEAAEPFDVSVNEETTIVSALVAANVGPPAFSTMPRELKNYWVHGRGALRVRWGVSGDFYRCRRNLGKYVSIRKLNGTCANLHKLATGVWPGKNAHG